MEKGEVEISHVEECEIIADVDGFEVIAPIVFHSHHHVFCSIYAHNGVHLKFRADIIP